jgi:lysyl endopeptidase
VKKISAILCIAFIFITGGIYAQISNGGMPVSYYQNLKSSVVIPTVKLKEINIDSLKQNDIDKGTPLRYGVVEDIELNVKNGLQTLVDSGTIWRYKISTPNARSLKLIVSDFHIPEGAAFFVYNYDFSLISGAFTHQNVNQTFSFAIADFPSNEIYIEYYEPLEASFEGTLIINQISKAYRFLSQIMLENSSNMTYDDINCDEGLNWQLEKHAVAKYTFIEDESSYTCSGALINNEQSDGTPYFLTAHHCVSTVDAAKTVTAYFNYETLGCGMTNKKNQTLSGAELLTTGDKSDFSLLKLSEMPPPAYQPYYAGWDLNEMPLSAVSIHHPEGLRKKISIEENPPVSYTQLIYWENNSISPSQSHWEVYFETGMTGGGSSGSPLFNENRRIIGQLHGGGDYDSYYGKLSYSWNNSLKSSRNNYKDLWEYLALQKNTSHINGYYPQNNLPEAVISIENKYVCTDAPVNLSEKSVFDVDKWKWEITPATVSFIEGTSPTSQSPVVRFDEEGTYSIQLIVENAYGKDIRTYNDAIVAGSEIFINFSSSPANGTCLIDADSLSITALGAANYKWELNNENDYFFTISDPNSKITTITQNLGTVIDSTINITGTLIGTHGTCSDTSYFDIQLIMPAGDNIANALLIEPGESGPYNNICASIEESEPAPTAGECVSQNEWCDEFGTGEDILASTVWFTFFGPQSGAVSIAATGMDGQIAIYKADTYTDLLNGNYTLMAANDDASYTDFTSFIKPVNIEKGKQYWLQFDGSYGNIQGEFYVELKEETGTNSIDTQISNTKSLKIYPQPAQNYIVVESNILTKQKSVTVKIFNNTGALLFNDKASIVNNQLTINFNTEWSNGIYLISIHTPSNETISDSFVLKK